jgi:Asp-tRNA(Asn)/Glu-tRNA(Gln) amidotransferase A subunit family amidase
VKTARWEHVDADAREAFAELVGFLGDHVEELDLGEPAVQALEWHRTILDAEMAANLDWAWERGRAQLSPSMVERLARGRDVRARDYLQALARRPALEAGFDELFAQRYEAILTPAASGTAPRGLESTGDPAFNAVWTLCGMPALTVPLMQGENGLPLGVQLVGPRHADGRLLRTARWLVESVGE